MGNKSGIITLDFSRTKVALVEKIGEMLKYKKIIIFAEIRFERVLRNEYERI